MCSRASTWRTSRAAPAAAKARSIAWAARTWPAPAEAERTRTRSSITGLRRGTRTRRAPGWTRPSSVPSPSTGSPSTWKRSGPSAAISNARTCRTRTSGAAGKDPVNTRRASQSRARRGRSSMTIRSRRPSSSRAPGIMRAPLPYCWPFAQNTSSARRRTGSPSSRMAYSRPPSRRTAWRPSARYGRSPRRSRACVLKRRATSASRPIPATLTKRRPPSSPTSIRRSAPLSATRRASAGDHGTPSVRARPLPDPAGTTPSAAGLKASIEATSFTVPSPPQAITRVAPRSTASRASARACWAAVVRKTSPGIPSAASAAWASSRRCRAVSRRPRAPDTGLMITATVIRLYSLRAMEPSSS